MAMRVHSTIAAFNQLLPRHATRKERTPGRQERHATHRERLSPEPRRKMLARSPKPETSRRSSYCYDSGTIYNQPVRAHAPIEPEVIISAYKELSTIEDIRADLKSTSSRKPVATKVTHVPDWMLNLDINLDVTSVDIIPPFENEEKPKSDTYKEKVGMSLLYDDDDDNDFYDSEDEIEKVDEDTLHRNLDELPTDKAQIHKSIVSTTGSEIRRPTTARSGRSGRSTPPKSARSDRRTPTGMFDDYGPRRYQGDKRVMSLQQGGIRSTRPRRRRRYRFDMRVRSMQQGGIRSNAMQPSSKKFINQMITYRHMKKHEDKLQNVKASVDTKMPSTFHIALARKRLVETRLSQSFDSTVDLSHTRSMSLDASHRTSNTSLSHGRSQHNLAARQPQQKHTQTDQSSKKGSQTDINVKQKTQKTKSKFR